jgi:hypothetical protein
MIPSTGSVTSEAAPLFACSEDRDVLAAEHPLMKAGTERPSHNRLRGP